MRDQTGQLITAQSAAVVFQKGTAESGRTDITKILLPDQNYELSVRIDAARPSTNLYTASAVAAQGPFSLLVEMGGRKYYPIEVKGNLTAGKGGERVRLDLTLGEDLDGDGLPDAWEQWQLYQAGIFPEENGWDLAKLDKAGDLDGDGQSNWLEYLAGTFAGDATERFELKIKEKVASTVSFEFFGITGKTYTMERSTDLKTWVRVPFAAGTAAAALSYSAGAVGVLPATCAAAADEPSAHYRLAVR